MTEGPDGFSPTSLGWVVLGSRLKRTEVVDQNSDGGSLHGHGRGYYSTQDPVYFSNQHGRTWIMIYSVKVERYLSTYGWRVTQTVLVEYDRQDRVPVNYSGTGVRGRDGPGSSYCQNKNFLNIKQRRLS